MPVIRTQSALAELAHGALLEVRATDPGTLADIPAWCRVHGHELISAEEIDSNSFRFVIQVVRV